MAKAAVWATAIIALLAMTGCASTDANNADPNNPSARQPRRCFSARDARRFAPVNSTTVNVRAGADTFRIDTVGTCRDLEWTTRMALQTRGASMVCAGPALGVSLVTRGPNGRQTCQVLSITALTPEEVQALPARQRP